MRINGFVDNKHALTGRVEAGHVLGVGLHLLCEFLVIYDDVALSPQRWCVWKTYDLNTILAAEFVEHLSSFMKLFFTLEQLGGIDYAIVGLRRHSFDHTAPKLRHEHNIGVCGHLAGIENLDELWTAI